MPRFRFKRQHHAATMPAPELPAEERCGRCHSATASTRPYREAMGQWLNVKRLLCAACAAKRPNLWQPIQRAPNRAARRQLDQQHRRDRAHWLRWDVTSAKRPAAT